MYHLIYRSHATAGFEAAQLPRLLEQARTFNLQHGITGVLLYTPDRQFLQVLVGSEAAVRALYYERILADPRHEDSYVLSEGHWPQRSFADWSMGVLTAQPLEAAANPGFVDRDRLRHVLTQLTPAHPSLSELLHQFVARYDGPG